MDKLKVWIGGGLCVLGARLVLWGLNLGGKGGTYVVIKSARYALRELQERAVVERFAEQLRKDLRVAAEKCPCRACTERRRKTAAAAN